MVSPPLRGRVDLPLGGLVYPGKQLLWQFYSPSQDPVEEYILTIKLQTFHNFTLQFFPQPYVLKSVKYVGLAPENDEVEGEEKNKTTFGEEFIAPTSVGGPSFKMFKRMSEKLIFKHLETNSCAQGKKIGFKDGWKLTTDCDVF